MLQERYPLWLAGHPWDEGDSIDVLDKVTGARVTSVARANADVLERAIVAASAAAKPMRQLASFERQAILEHCATRFRERAVELANVLCAEAGKPIRDARGEVERLIDTFRIAAGESIRITGEVMPLDVTPRAKGYSGMWKRVPIGPCAFISPFNFPLNLVAHKVAPALAVGNPFVLKPASSTPVGALIIGEVLAETDLPEGAFSILPLARTEADPLTEDPRFHMLSFTGSPDVGWDMKARAGRKKVALELGGNAAVIVDADTDLHDACQRILVGAFYQSGQSCIGVQRILMHTDIADALRAKLIAGAQQLIVGDPRNEDTFLGPLITEGDAVRLECWVRDAVAGGATLLCGGNRDGSFLDATLLEGVPQDMPLCADEAFGPVAILSTFDDFDVALEQVNASRYGLQAGIFTRDLYKAQRAFDELEVGGVVIGDVPSWRVDHMPYGGVKESGFGREGLRFAMEEMSEARLLVVRDLP